MAQGEIELSRSQCLMNGIVNSGMVMVATLTLTTAKSMCCLDVNPCTTTIACVRST